MQEHLTRLTSNAFLSSKHLSLSAIVSSSSPNQRSALSYDKMSPGIKAMRHEAIGPLLLRAIEIEKELNEGKSYPFKDIINATVGDAHAMGQKPITFVRQVIACVTHPIYLTLPDFPSDVKDHAKQILASCEGGSVGKLIL